MLTKQRDTVKAFSPEQLKTLALLKVAAVIGRYRFVGILFDWKVSQICALNKLRKFTFKDDQGNRKIHPEYYADMDNALGLLLLSEPGFLGSLNKEYTEAVAFLNRSVHMELNTTTFRWYPKEGEL